MNLKLDGKHALITGASKGIGFACAMRLAQEGCNVRLVARTEVDLEAAKQRIAQHSRVEVKIFPCDLSQGEAARALMALSRALGSDSLKYGVRVIGVNPGLIRTERLRTQMQRLAKLKFGDESRWQELVNPELPPGEPENIADTVALLASDLSGYTTGTIVTIDGGASARFA